MYDLDFITSLSESSILLLGDPELLALWEDAHHRIIQKARGYQVERIGRQEKIDREMIKPKNVSPYMDNKAKAKARKDFKTQPIFLGVFDNKKDAENTAGRAASLRQNIDHMKFSNEGQKNPKQRFTVYGTGNKNNRYMLHAIENDRSTKWEDALDDERKRNKQKEIAEKTGIDPNKFAKGHHGSAQPLRRSYYLTPEGGEDTKVHERNHIKDFDDTKRMFGKNAAKKLIVDAKERSKKNADLQGKFENYKREHGIDPDKSVYDFTKSEQKANPELRKAIVKAKWGQHNYMKNPSEQNSHLLGALQRGGQLKDIDKSKIANVRHKNIRDFLKGKPSNTFVRSDKFNRY